MAKHTLFDGRLHLYKRDRSRYWQCATFLEGKKHRTSTKEESLGKAKDFAEDWYLGLRGKIRMGEPVGEKTFGEAADQFLKEFTLITGGDRSERYVRNMKRQLRLYILPFFAEKGLSQITAGAVQEYRLHRQTYQVPHPSRKRVGKEEDEGAPRPPSRSTLHQEVVVIRQVLKTAIRHGWLKHLPDLSMPYKTAGKFTRRAWFNPEEYKKLYEATRRLAKNPPLERLRWNAEQLHDFVLFMANTGLRPDEAKRLEYRDVQIVKDDQTGETILEIDVRGKRGTGYCKSTSGAVTPFRRLKKRNSPTPETRIFPKDQIRLLNKVLDEHDLKFDRDGQRRTAYSLRHTYICLRLMEGADIYQIAKNCRTSVDMIEQYYAAHIKNRLDAAAINVRRVKKKSA
ncbi:MAG: site-specific integrase [Pseudomonadota bacterium]